MIYKKSWKYILIKCRYSYYRPMALKDFGDVSKGDIGGYLDGYYNLSQIGNCWVYDNALVKENANVSENAIISGDAIIKENAQVCNSAIVSGQSTVFGHAKVIGNATIKNRVLSEGIYRK